MGKWRIVLVLVVFYSLALPSRGEGVSVINDRQMVMTACTEGGKLIDAGKCVSADDLAKQLRSARQCALKLTPCPAAPIADDAFYEQVKPSVVFMAGVYKCPKCHQWHAITATGWIITATGAVVTNYHVIAGNRPGKPAADFAMTADGKIYPVKSVLAANRLDDVAIVQLDTDRSDFHPLPLQPDAAVGTRVRVLSHPNDMMYSLTEGIISRYMLMPTPNGGTARMSITADYAKGSSGGPVMNDRGAVVGMVASTFSIYYDVKDGHQENLQMVVKQCVPASSIRKLITN